MYNCALCTKTFKTISTLEQHIFSHTKEKPHNCQMCSATFGMHYNLARHVKAVHHGIKNIQIRKVQQRPGCSYKCYCKTELDIHLRKHSDEKPFTCDIAGCGFKTKYKSSLRAHARGVHSDKNLIECPSDGCNYKCRFRKQLKSHLRIHSTEKPCACQVPGCLYNCRLQSLLTTHCLKAHSVHKPVKCSTRNVRTKSSSDLIQQQVTQMKVKRFQCQVPNCGYASHRKHIVEAHFNAKHRKKDVRCTEAGCNFRCGSMNLLKVHLKGRQLPISKCNGPSDSNSQSTKSKNSSFQLVTRLREDGLSGTVVVGPTVPVVVLKRLHVNVM